MDEEVTIVGENHEERGKSVESQDSLDDWAARYEEDSGGEEIGPDFGASKHEEEDEAEVESHRQVRRSNQTKVASPEKPPMKPTAKRRLVDEEEELPVALKKLKTRKQVDAGGEVENDVIC
ncbi:hypothetical protein RvY_02738 [Ramazzottius varieornatus]|uniref:Uncharacterized protein n=1 Tax=Ramazzottius varieornatus TaxID=947166 RepID=A0A1D1UVB1_RAMVA|nr:hypothetical protein RvY_02738 [Ramazzottius varieornatus]